MAETEDVNAAFDSLLVAEDLVVSKGWEVGYKVGKEEGRQAGGREAWQGERRAGWTGNRLLPGLL